MLRRAVEGLRRIEVIWRWAVRSSVKRVLVSWLVWSVFVYRILEEDGLSCTEFHSCVELSFDMDMIPFAVP
jgi:hypothetical protein